MTAFLLARVPGPQDAQESIAEMREHDVPYHVRFAIDTDVRCGHWFSVSAKVGGLGGGWLLRCWPPQLVHGGWALVG